MFLCLKALPRLEGKGDISRMHRGRNHLTEGAMVMEGAYLGLFGATKGAHSYARCQDADGDGDFLCAEALRFLGLQAMEALHVCVLLR